MNNAGSGVRAWGGGGQRLVAFAESGPEDWDPVIRVNLAGVLHVTRAYLTAMLDARWGRILVIVSDAGRRGERRQVVYGAAKAAAMGFVRGLAAEVGRDGVTVNCISLGSMKHAALADAIDADPDLEAKLARAYPVGRLGRVERPRTPGRPALQRRRRVDHRAGVPGRRRIRARALTHGAGAAPVSADVSEAGVSVTRWRPAPRLGLDAPRARRRSPRAGRTAKRAPDPEPPRFDLAAAARRQLRAHRGDAAGVGLLVLAALTALGLASDLAGGVGRGLADGLGAVVGQARYGVPVACAVAALACLRARAPQPVDDDHPDAAAPEPPTLRIGLGAVLVTIAVVGLLHLAAGAPALDRAVATMRAAGGYLGAVTGGPLANAAGTVGAAVILVGLGVLGALLVTGASVRRVTAALAGGARVAAHGARQLTARSTDPDAPVLDLTASAADGEAPSPAALYDLDRDADAGPPHDPDADPTQPGLDPVPVVEEAGGQMALDVARRGRPGAWKLPPRPCSPAAARRRPTAASRRPPAPCLPRRCSSTASTPA